MATKPNKDTRKPADYGDKKQKTTMPMVLKVKSNNQCKRAGTNDARDTKYK